MLNTNKTNAGSIQNHSLPSEWMLPPHVVKDIEDLHYMSNYLSKEVQKGTGMGDTDLYMQVSLAAANIVKVLPINIYPISCYISSNFSIANNLCYIVMVAGLRFI